MQLCLFNTQIHKTEPKNSAKQQLSQRVSLVVLYLYENIFPFQSSFTQ